MPRIGKSNFKKTKPHDGVLFSHKKERSTDSRYIMGEPGRRHAQWKKPDTKGHVPYNSIYPKCPEQVNQ